MVTYKIGDRFKWKYGRQSGSEAYIVEIIEEGMFFVLEGKRKGTRIPFGYYGGPDHTHWEFVETKSEKAIDFYERIK